MTAPSAVTTRAFLTPGKHLDDDPARGLDETLDLFEDAARLGLDGGWIRPRHLAAAFGPPADRAGTLALLAGRAPGAAN